VEPLKSRDPDESDADVIGRDEERSKIADWLGATRPSTLLIEGEAGIGKSTLLADAVAQAVRRGDHVLAWRAGEAERELAFVVLRALLEDPAAEPAIRSTAAPRRRALDAALARGEDDAGPTGAVDGGLIGVAVTDVLRALARDRPLLVAVDDVQWCDGPSRDALAFAARRMAGAAAAFLYARRTAMPSPGVAPVAGSHDGAGRITLGPLSVGALGRLVHARQGIVHPRPLLVRIHAASGGNPFVAMEISRSIVVRGQAPAPDEPFPVPPHAVPLVRDHIAGLSAAARRSLLVVAMAASPTLQLVERVLGEEARSGVDEACRAGMLVADGRGLRPGHPLYASSVDADAAPAEREALRRALAVITDDPVERALLLAGTVHEPDAAVAGALADAARTALGRGAPSVAGALFLRAAGLTPGPAPGDMERSGLELSAADAFVRAGDPARAREILTALLDAGTTGGRRAEALLALAEIVYVERPTEAIPLLTDALRFAGDDDLLRVAVHVHIAALADNDPETGGRSSAAAVGILERTTAIPDPDLIACALLERAYTWLVAAEHIASEDVERALALLSPAGDTFAARRARELASRWSSRVGRFDTALELELRELRRVEDHGDVGLVPPLLQSIAVLEQLKGDWRAARTHARMCLDLVEQGEAAWRQRALMAWGRTLAWEGDLDEARRIGLAAVALEESAGDAWEAAIFRSMLGFIELSIPHPGAALEHLRIALDHARSLRVVLPTVFRFDGDLVEAAVLAGDLELARGILEERLEPPAARLGIPWILAVAERSRGLVEAAHGRLDAALESFDRSLGRHDARSPIPFERGRTLLARGQVHRRAGHRAAARDDLSAAAAAFETLGAAAWHRRAIEELGRIAGRARSALDLTGSERRVAELAAAGRSNREIAAELVVSPRTVESQLSAAYRKLDVRSRSQLRDALGRTLRGSTDADGSDPA
jgi:DNA-binding CsgD family transcriptional regulator